MFTNRHSVTLFVVAVLAGCQSYTPADDTPSQAAVSPEAAVAEIRRLFEAWESDWSANPPNLEGAFALLADDVVQMAPDTVLVGKDALTAMWQKGNEDNIVVWEPTIDDIQAAGNLVFIKGHFTETVTPKAGGDTRIMTGKGIWVFRRDMSGAWKLLLEQWFRGEPDI